MPLVPVAEKMTAERFLALPVSESTRTRELIDGEVVVSEARLLHAFVVTNLLFALATWTRAKPGRGRAFVPIDVAVDEHNVFVPDLLWYAQTRAPDVESPPPYLMPDLAVEVRSPSTWRYDIGVKKTRYEEHGLPELWLVDTDARTVLVFRRSAPRAPAFDVAVELDGAQEVCSPLMPGFSLSLPELFPSR